MVIKLWKNNLALTISLEYCSIADVTAISRLVPVVPKGPLDHE